MAAKDTSRKPSPPKYVDGDAVFEMGEHTLKVPMSLHGENRNRLLESLRTTDPNLPDGGVILLQGGEESTLYSADTEPIFRQESYFHWAFGVLEPNWYGAIDVSTGRTTLFCPRLPESYGVWMGRITEVEEFRVRYQVDEVRYVDEMADSLQNLHPTTTLLTLRGINSDSGKTTLEAAFDGISKFKVNNSVLHDVMARCRVTKSKAELQILRFAAEISSAAHKAVMKKIRPGMKEYQLEAIFRYYSYYYGGCRHQAYTSICGSGINASVLHYGHAGAPNARTIRDGDMCLFDMGSEYYCYTADITCSFPANGKFTSDQKLIYNAVFAASRAASAAARPGVSWVDLHAIAYRAMLQKLKEGGLLVGDVEDMMKVNLGAIFQPHGLGHLLGLDVHDVGGYLDDCPPRPELDGFRSLRMARELEENMVVTIEPGCYFIDMLLDRALANPEQAAFINQEALQRFRGFGGVRIEDDVIITADGIENITQVPRTVEEIEALMAEGQSEKVDIPQLYAEQKLSH